MNSRGDRRIRVLIVEDSRTVRELLEHLIGSDPRLEVLASVSTGEEALSVIKRGRPDVISLDIRLPGMDGFQMTREVMHRYPTPIVIFAASVQCSELNIAMNALRAGALSVVEKPRGGTHGAYHALAERLCTQLAIMSQVRVVRQRIAPRLPIEVGEPPQVSRTVDTSAVTDAVIGIAASTGGPNALTRLLGGLPATFPAPILLVQHISAAFSQGFIEWLGSVTLLRVVQAQSNMRPRPGCVYVAPADRHLIHTGQALRLVSDVPVSGQRPSATVMFQSMARHLDSRAIGVVLTGMGADGADGLLEIRRAGGFTIAESKDTAVVYGMPAAAVRLGAACESLPFDDIAPRLTTLVHESALTLES